MSDYTVEDFKNARFATTAAGTYAAHREFGGWCVANSERFSDEGMHAAGWIPVPDQVPGQTITESDFCEAVDKTDEWTDEGFARTVLDRLGITVIPDPEPEPTNLQRLTRAIRDWDEGRGADRILARHLDAIGVKAPTDD